MTVAEAQEQLRKAIKDLTGCNAKIDISIFDIRNPELRDTNKAMEVATTLRNDVGGPVGIHHKGKQTCITVGPNIYIYA